LNTTPLFQGSCPTGILAKEKMMALTADRSIHGLLAYNENLCVGWIAVDPMTNLVGHDLQSTGKVKEWSIHCLFVRDGFRGQGISTQLIQAAVEFAKANGAKVVSAFPIPHENQTRFPPNEAEFSGRFLTYQKLGFKSVGPASNFYQRMEHE
jgi:GNAT superfamily N-acetyltransferase